MEPGRFEVTLKALLLDGDRLLVLRDRASGEGDLPGGRIGQDELDPALPWSVALSRELREELGPDASWAVEPEPSFVWRHRFPSTGNLGLGVAFVGRWRGGPVILSDEHDAFRWVRLTDWDPEGWFVGTLAAAVARFVDGQARRQPG